MDLFRKSPRLVLARIGLITLDEDLARRFEPFAAPPASRVMNIVNMVQAGVRVSVRIDPILPGISDSGESLSRLIETISSAGASALSISALVMRPRIARQLLEELPAPLARDILRHYAGQPYRRVMTSERTQLLPKPLRLAQYARIKDIARRLNLPCSLCGCKNPDLPWESCDLGTDASRSVQRQLPLFQAK
jgi:DNA repair photolyase